jgi:hypothetical protein
LKADFIDTQSELQSLFMDCINAVKPQIHKRHAVSLAFKQQMAMSASEKRNVLDRLLSNENVLLMLFDKMFPY